MTNIAILGFGVVGGGVAEMITKNSAEIQKVSGEEINIKYILDLKDFPDSPFADKVIHDEQFHNEQQGRNNLYPWVQSVDQRFTGIILS